MNLLPKSLIIFAITFSVSSCAYSIVDKKKNEYASINTEFAKDITDKLKKSAFYEVDAYYNGKKEFPNISSSKEKKSPNIYDEYLVPNLLDGEERVLQILIKPDNRPLSNASTQAVFKEDKILFKRSGVLFNYAPHQRACEQPIDSIVHVNKWVNLKSSLNEKTSQEIELSKKINRYHQYFIVNELSSVRQEDLKDKPKIKLFISDDKNLFFTNYIILTTKTFKLDNEEGLYFFNPIIIRDRQNKFLSNAFDKANEDNKIVLILNTSNDLDQKTRSFIIARKHNKEWSCFFSQGKEEYVNYVKRNKSGVSQIETMENFALLNDIITSPVQLPVFLYLIFKKDVDPNKIEEESFRRGVFEEYIKYQNNIKNRR